MRRRGGVGDGSALTGLRLRRLISFLRRHRLYDTAHALERQTALFFDAPRLRRMLLDDRCASASSYALRFVTVGDCSPEADWLNVRILFLQVVSDLTGGGDRARSVEGLFRRIYAAIDNHPYCQPLRTLLLSMRSDRPKAFRLYRLYKPKAVEGIMDLVAKYPELQAKARLPRCTFDPTYVMSLGPGFLRRARPHRRSKPACIPAIVITCFFLQKSLYRRSSRGRRPSRFRRNRRRRPSRSRRSLRRRRRRNSGKRAGTTRRS